MPSTATVARLRQDAEDAAEPEDELPEDEDSVDDNDDDDEVCTH